MRSLSMRWFIASTAVMRPSNSPICRMKAAGSNPRTRLEIGERLAIAIPRLGQLNAQIRWALHGSAGAKFLNDDGEA